MSIGLSWVWSNLGKGHEPHFYEMGQNLPETSYNCHIPCNLVFRFTFGVNEKSSSIFFLLTLFLDPALICIIVTTNYSSICLAWERERGKNFRHMHLSDCKRGGKNCCCFRWPQTFYFFVSAHPRTLITQIGFTCPFLCNMIFKPRSKVKGVIEMKKVFTSTNEN